MSVNQQINKRKFSIRIPEEVIRYDLYFPITINFDKPLILNSFGPIGNCRRDDDLMSSDVTVAVVGSGLTCERCGNGIKCLTLKRQYGKRKVESHTFYMKVNCTPRHMKRPITGNLRIYFNDEKRYTEVPLAFHKVLANRRSADPVFDPDCPPISINNYCIPRQLITFNV